jgi:hypothetical protein
MSLPGANELLSDVSPGWRRAGYAAMLAGFIVAAYFIFVSGRIADAMELGQRNEKRIDRVERDISDIKGDTSDIRATMAAQAQKVDDLNEAVQAMNKKLDELLMREGRRAQAYP